MTVVVFRPEAEADLAFLARYLAEQDATLALRTVRRLRARTRILASHPFAGRARTDLGADLRSLVERPYVILYCVVSGAAEIVAIVHGARDLPSIVARRVLDEPEK